MAGRRLTTQQLGTSPRLFERTDVWFLTLLAAELLSFPFVPFLPLALALLSLASPLRRSRWRVVTLLLVGVVMAAIVAAPYILSGLGLQFVDEGPVRSIDPLGD